MIAVSGEQGWQPSAQLDALRLRARLNALVRAFFAQRDVLEVETPMLSAAGNTEPNIASFSLQFEGPAQAGTRTRWLRTSPEFALKRLLAAGAGDCYELGRVFRDGEAGGRHNPEFTMLEWYRLGMDHRQIADEAAALVQQAMALTGRRVAIRRCSYRALFRSHLGLDPMRADARTLMAAMGDIGVNPAGLERDDWLDLLMSHRIQPALDADTLLVVHDYPATQCMLARVRDDDGDPDPAPVASRFELFLGPLELANGYHELRDAHEQARRFSDEQARRRQRGLPVPPSDARLIAALQHGLPDCAGVALGVDRLLMAMHDSHTIAAMLAFDFSRA